MDVQAFTTSQSVIRARESTQNVPTERAVREVSDKLAYLDPNAAPFTLILQKGKKKASPSTKFEWMEKELPAKWDQVNNASTAYTTGATSVVVDNSGYFSVGDVVNAVATGEKMRVSAVDDATDTLTFIRGVGSTSAATASLANNADLQIIGNAYAEGSPLGLEKSHVESYKFNYTQIVRTPFGVTGSEKESENYTGPDAPRLRAEKGIEHKIELERTAIFGERALDTSSTNNPRRYTGGAYFWLVDNIKDASGTLTYLELTQWLQDVFQHTAGGDSRLLLASPSICTILDQIAMVTTNVNYNVTPETETFGISVKQWKTSHGTFNVVKHRLFETGPGGDGYGDQALLVDPSLWSYRPLRNRDTKLRQNVGTPGDDATTDEYLTEMGWQVGLSKTQGILQNVTTAG